MEDTIQLGHGVTVFAVRKFVYIMFFERSATGLEATNREATDFYPTGPISGDQIVMDIEASATRNISPANEVRGDVLSDILRDYNTDSPQLETDFVNVSAYAREL